MLQNCSIYTLNNDNENKENRTTITYKYISPIQLIIQIPIQFALILPWQFCNVCVYLYIICTITHPILPSFQWRLRSQRSLLFLLLNENYFMLLELLLLKENEEFFVFCRSLCFVVGLRKRNASFYIIMVLGIFLYSTVPLYQAT